jgi:hypothetical protein
MVHATASRSGRSLTIIMLYQFPGEALAETRNGTVHGYVCTALARTATGYRLYWGST